MFYEYEQTFNSLEELEKANADYFDCYYNKRMKVKLKPHTIASIHRLIRTMYYLITHNKLYDYTSTQNR